MQESNRQYGARYARMLNGTWQDQVVSYLPKCI